MAQKDLQTRLRRTLKSLATLIVEIGSLPPDELSELLLGVEREAQLVRRALTTEELIAGVKHAEDE